MIKYPNLIPECNVETVFVEMLGYKEPNHAPSISDVSVILQKKATQKAMGFIDEDKIKPGYFSQFIQIDKSDNVRLLKHPERAHYLVVVSPAMDGFIFNLCSELGIKLAKYKLPGRLKPFIDFTKKGSIKKDPDFKNLLNTIMQKKPAVITKIKSWIIKHSPYKD